MTDMTGESAMSSSLSPDEKYLFFLKRYKNEGLIFWVRIDEYIKKQREENKK